jgi:hypothetical protein
MAGIIILKTGVLYGFILRGNTLVKIWSLTGINEFEQVSHDFSFGYPYNNQDLIIAISLPNYSHDKLKNESVGCIYLFKYEDFKGDITLNDLKYTTKFIGNQSFSRFGWKSDFYNSDINSLPNDFIFSEPLKSLNGKYVAGSFYYFKGGSSFPRGDVFNCHNRATKYYEHSIQRSKLGSNFIFGNFFDITKNDIIISSPFEQEGAVYHFKL